MNECAASILVFMTLFRTASFVDSKYLDPCPGLGKNILEGCETFRYDAVLLPHVFPLKSRNLFYARYGTSLCVASAFFG